MSEDSTVCIVCHSEVDLVQLEHVDATAPTGFSTPPGHRVICFSCAKELQRREMPCPTCRVIVWRIHPDDDDLSTPTPMEVDEYEGVPDLWPSPPATPARPSETPVPSSPQPEPVRPREAPARPQQYRARPRETATSLQQNPARPRETPAPTTGLESTPPLPILTGECHWKGRRTRNGCKGPFYRSDIDHGQYCLGHLESGPLYAAQSAQKRKLEEIYEHQKIAEKAEKQLRRLQCDTDDLSAQVQTRGLAISQRLVRRRVISPHPDEAQ